MLSLQKNDQFFIQKFISILHVKWTGMNKGEQVENLNKHFLSEHWQIHWTQLIDKFLTF